MGVLLGDVGTELDMFLDCFAEPFVGREASLVRRLQVDADEAVALLVSDVQVAVNVDQVLKPELAAEAVRAAERLGREPGQVLDVGATGFVNTCLRTSSARAFA